MTTAVLTPAYGKQFSTIAELTEAFQNGEDFILQTITHRDSGRVCNIRDLKKYTDFRMAELRFGRYFENFTLVQI